MQPTNTHTYIISGIVAVLAIALIAGAYMFDNRFEGKTADENSAASSTISLATSTLSSFATSSTSTTTSPLGSNPNTKAAPIVTPGDKSGFITLETHSHITQADTSSWEVYTNTKYRFSLKYPNVAKVRKFIDGKGIDYGIGLTLETPGNKFTEKYFELTIDTGETAVCDALLDEETTDKSAFISGMHFIRKEFSDGSSRGVEYVGRANNVCYRGYLRLNNPFTGNITVADVNTELQVLEDIMFSFKLAK